MQPRRCHIPRRPLIFLLLVLVLALAGPGAVRAEKGDGVITVAEFHALISNGAREIEAAGDADAQQQAIRDLQAELDAVDGILLDSGDTIHPVTDFIDPDDVDATLARLRLLDSQLTLAANDDTDARLAQLEETLQALKMEKLDEVTPRQATSKEPSSLLESLPAIGEVLKWAVMLAGGALLIYILGSWLSKLLGGFVADAELRRQEANGGSPVTSRQAREMATDMARSGNYREAVRHLYLSALFKLEETGAVPRDRSKTNRELLAAVSGDGPLQQHLKPVVETFDRVWYGVREPDDTTFHHYEQEIDQLNQLLSRPQRDANPPDDSGRNE